MLRFIVITLHVTKPGSKKKKTMRKISMLKIHARVLALALLLLIPPQGTHRTSVVAGAPRSRTEVEIMQRK